MGDAVKDWRLDNLETTSLDLRGANLVCKPYPYMRRIGIMTIVAAAGTD